MTDEQIDASVDGIEPGQMCEYCGNNPAIEWSDQGRAQCEICSPNTDTDQSEEDSDDSGPDHKPASSLRDEDSVLGGDLEI